VAIFTAGNVFTYGFSNQEKHLLVLSAKVVFHKINLFPFLPKKIMMIPENKEINQMICQIDLVDRGLRLCQIKTFRMGGLEYLHNDLEVIMEALLWDLACFLHCLH
jgi:hypothetical protein